MRVVTKYALLFFAITSFFIILAIAAAAMSDIGGMAFLLAFAAIFGFFGTRILRKQPKEQVEVLGGKGLFSSWYWFNEKGIWKDNKFFLPWTEINDIIVFRTFMRHYNRSRTFTVLDATRPNPESMEFGSIKVITNDGRQIEIKEVISPHSVVDFIKKTYLKK